NRVRAAMRQGHPADPSPHRLPWSVGSGAAAARLSPAEVTSRHSREAVDRCSLGDMRASDGSRADRVRFEEAEEDLRKHYGATGTRDLDEYTRRVAHLTRHFTGVGISTIGQPEVDRYVAKRTTDGVRGSTVRRELGTLTKLLRLSFRNGKLMRVHLPEDLSVAADVAYRLGWRVQSEVLTLERRHIDLEAGVIRLEAARSKNRRGRV